jgi:hypothetical protein
MRTNNASSSRFMGTNAIGSETLTPHVPHRQEAHPNLIWILFLRAVTSSFWSAIASALSCPGKKVIFDIKPTPQNRGAPR